MFYCISKFLQETSLKNELELLNEKVKYLIQDNEDLQTKIVSFMYLSSYSSSNFTQIWALFNKYIVLTCLTH